LNGRRMIMMVIVRMFVVMMAVIVVSMSVLTLSKANVIDIDQQRIALGPL
jgi:hypothetical protein